MKRKRGCVSTAPIFFASNWMKDDRGGQSRGARKRGEQSCYVKILLGLFHLTKPSVLQWFAALGKVRQTCLGQTLAVRIKMMRINKRQRLRTADF